jgi:WD40 repeat protein
MAFGSSAGLISIRDENGDELDRWEALNGGIWSVNWSEDNLFSCDSDGWVRLWTPSDPGPVGKTLPKADYLVWKGNELIGFNSLGTWRYSNDGNLSETKRNFGKIVAATDTIAVSKETEDIVKVHRLDPKKKSLSFIDLPTNHSIKEIELSANGTYLAISWWPEDSDSSTGRLCIWNVAENKVTWLQQAPDYISALAFFKDEFLAASGRGGSLTVWRVDDGKLMNQLKDDNGIPIEALAFADRENLLTGNLRGFIELHRVGKLGVSISRTEIPTGAIRDIAATIDGNIIATDVDGANWFDASLTYKGKLLNTEGSLDKAWNISVSPKGKSVAFKLQSGKTVLVPLAIEEWVTAARARAIVGTGSM